jgi:lambda family phage portal protein
MCGILTDVKMLGGYREAEITNRRLSAAKMGFFKRIMPSGPVEGIADSIDPDTGALEMDVEPGKMSVLPDGYEFDKFDSSGSSTDYSDFEKQILRSIAAGLGPSYVDLAMDLEGVSYSSIRQGALSDRDFYRGMQKFFIEDFALPIFSDWFRSALDFGDTGLPSFRYNKFHDAAYFRPRGWQWVDPQREVQAAIKANENNMASLTHIVGEQGREFDEVVGEIETERRVLDAAGLTPQEVIPNGGKK